MRIFSHPLKNRANMNNDNPDLSSANLRMREHVEHYMYLKDNVMQQPVSMLEHHDDLCRLVLTIADDYPDSIAPNPGKVLDFPKVVTDSDKKSFFDFEAFVRLFSRNIPYHEQLPMKGDHVFFLTLSLWYEVAKLREMLKIKGVKFSRFDKELLLTQKLARERLRQEALLLEHRNASRDLPAHFSLSVPPNVSLPDILQALKDEGWLDPRTRDEDWIFRLTGQIQPNTYPSQEPILFRSLNQCRYIVKNLIFRNSDVPKEAWRKVPQVFAVSKGDISRVQRANKMPSGSNRIDFLLG